MDNAIRIQANTKNDNGTGSARALRREGKLPAILYGGTHKEVMMSLDTKEFSKEYLKGNIYSKLFKISLDQDEIIAIPRAVQVHAVSEVPLHVDFQEVTTDTTVKISVYVRVINEDKAPGIKKGGVLNIVSRKIACVCKADSIPENITVDITGLEIGRNIHINDIELPSGAKPIDRTNFTVVSISGRSEETEGTAETAPATTA